MRLERDETAPIDSSAYNRYERFTRLISANKRLMSFMYSFKSLRSAVSSSSSVLLYVHRNHRTIMDFHTAPELLREFSVALRPQKL